MTTEASSASALAERLAGAGARFEGERRLVTALFADVSGFTRLAGTLDAEDLLELIDPLLAALADVVARYGGYVEKFAGDALLAVFGAPVSHEDDPARALLVALELHRELDRLKGEYELALHVGVNTGHGIARLIGNEARVDYGVLGEAVIVAQRLESEAPPGAVYVGDQTYRLTRLRFEFEEVGELAVKGKLEPVRAWRLIGERAKEATREVGPLVGRDDELATLARSLDELPAGRGSVVALVGEPGVGKTRLAAEARAYADDRAVRWLQARCPSYGASLAYFPYTELLHSEPHEPNPHFARLLGAPSAVDALDPETFRVGLHEAFAAWLAAAQPVVLALEDVHWADASSLELTARLAQLAGSERVLVLITGRPEAEPLAADLGATMLALAPLESGDVEALIEGLLGADPPAALVDAVVERTSGNAFFVEELVRSLRETGALTEEDGRWRLDDAWNDASVPPTVEGVLSARIDLLSAGGATLLQTAAVIGRRVPLDLLDAIAPANDVDELLARGFVDPAGAEVVFHHALIQDVAYGRLLRKHRRVLHARVAEAAEELYGAGDETIELLARHHDLAGTDQAVDYLTRAGERAVRLYANEQAIEYFRRALAHLEGDGQRAARLHERIGDLLLTAARNDEAREEWDRAVELDDDPIAVSRIEGMRAYSFAVQRRYDEGAAALARAERALGPEPAAPDDDWQRAWIDLVDHRISLLYWMNRPDEMNRLIEDARPVVERVGTPTQRTSFFESLLLMRLRRELYAPSPETVAVARALLAAAEESDQLVRAFNTAFTLLWADELDEAEAKLLESLAEAERIGHMTMRVRSLVYLCVLWRKRADRERVRETISRIREIEPEVRTTGYGALLDANAAWLAWQDGDLAGAERLASAALDAPAEPASPLVIFRWVAVWPLVSALLARGVVPPAVEAARELLDPVRQPAPDAVAAAIVDAVEADDEAAARAGLERGLEAAKRANRA